MKLSTKSAQTELGLFPSDWIETTVDAFEPFITSGSRGWARFYFDRGDLFVRITNMTRESVRLSLHDCKFVKLPPSGHEGNRTRLINGDVLISVTADIGIVSFIDEAVPKPAYINQHIALVRFQHNDVSPPFVAHFLAHYPSQRRFRAITDQGAKAGLNLATVRATKLVLPPTKAEQEAIAGALSDADRLIDSLERLIAKKCQLKQAAMQELLTGKRRLPGFSGKWEQTTLGELATFLSGATPSRSNKDYWMGDIPWISATSLRCFEIWRSDSNVTREAVVTGSKMAPVGSSLLLVRGSALHNEILCGLVTKPVCFNQDVKALVPRPQVAPRFLTLFIKGMAEAFLKMVSSAGNTAGVLDTKLLKAFAINLPTLGEQTAIASTLSEMDTEIEMLKAKLAKARHIKQGMMQTLLTGQIRLIGAEIKENIASKPAASSSENHNWQINEAVVISVLTKMFGSEQFPLGRKRHTKLSYLLHRHVERRAVGYLKKAAGPYNPSTKYGGPEGIAISNKYIRQHKRDNFVGFVAADEIVKAEAYFDKWYGKEVISWLEQFRWVRNDDLELWATVDMALVELREAGIAVSVASVKEAIGRNPEWLPKLDRDLFSDVGIASAISKCDWLFEGGTTGAQS